MQTTPNPNSHKYVLSIDAGTGGPKVGIVDQQGNIAGSARGFYPIYYLPDKGAEQDPDEWWSTIVKACKQAMAVAKVPKESIIAVSVTGQWGVIVPVDENGKPLMRALHWSDKRGAPYNRQVVKGFPTIQGYGLNKLIKYMKLCGFPPMLSGIDSLGHMLFIKNEKPDIYRKTYKFQEPMDYINQRLTGKFVATTNSMLFDFLTDMNDLDTLEYHPWLLAVSGLDKEKLPELVPIDSILGKLTLDAAKEFGLDPSTVVVTGTADNSTSAVGSGAIAMGEVAAVLGTSGYLASHLPKKKSDLTHMIFTFPSAIRGLYQAVAETANTGRVLDTYLGNLIFDHEEFISGEVTQDIYQRMNRIARQVPAGSYGVLFLPWFFGAVAPQGDDYVRGGFINLTNRTSRKELTRAVLEGIAFNWRWLRKPYEDFIGYKPAYWRLTGGGALSDVWAQIMADVVGIPMHQQEDPRNNNVIGAAYLAFQRLGMLPWEDIPKQVKFVRVFEPQQKNKEVYDKMFEQFVAAYKRLRPTFHTLNK